MFNTLFSAILKPARVERARKSFDSIAPRWVCVKLITLSELKEFSQSVYDLLKEKVLTNAKILT